MKEEKDPPWEFFGYESIEEGRPVQDWYDDLESEAQLEILSLISHLRVLPIGRWRQETGPTRSFDPLEGEEGISELRPNDIRLDQGSLSYRIYGVHDHPSKRSYSFLHGTLKGAKNDRDGKAIAKWRLRNIARNRAKVHRFDF